MVTNGNLNVRFIYFPIQQPVCANFSHCCTAPFEDMKPFILQYHRQGKGVTQICQELKRHYNTDQYNVGYVIAACDDGRKMLISVIA
jgi:hypothetical protein